MKYKELKDRHDQLEQDILNALRQEIEDSKTESKHTNSDCIKVNVFGYEELAIIDGVLTFLDDNGYHYGIYSECSLEDLVDILAMI